VSSLNQEQKEIRQKDEQSNHTKKSVIDSIVRKIEELEINHLHELERASYNIGLQESEKATRIFDDVLKLEGELLNPHANDHDLNNTQEIYDDIVNNIDSLNDEQGILYVNLQNLDTEYSQHERELQDLKAERQNKARENLRIEKILAEFEKKEELLAQEVEKLRENSVPIKDISLMTSKRITEDKKMVNSAATIRVNIEGEQLELEPEKLSSTLVGQNYSRDKARTNLQEGESKWKNKVSRLYEGVDELFTPSTQEMNQRAEIHSLLDELKS